MCEVEISMRAYVKMCLHAARYPHMAVNGVLLGYGGSQTGCLYLTDCVPLSHGLLPLSLPLEVALSQIDLWRAEKEDGRVLAGYYQANSSLDEKSPSTAAVRIAGRVSEYFEDAVLIMLDNRSLSVNAGVPPVIVLQQKDRRWIPKDKNLVMWRNWEEMRNVVKVLLESKAYRRLVDFDAHLDDIRKDWTNQGINAEIAQLTSTANGSTG
ncbi:ER membrane protein complex subunit 9 [Rhinatrema bivittatum]|uniref:ER membrane protein complex subunit 9 n=1 Tax=Rhinatrema bivittatum TaxID=194408 RepID=UPI0011261395|nr:ER membrane protein complex subunit 9 [Rhinatrema bivittatum]XP_029437500.1 ER membrane protein complex subunit 9 [Rhinatrema bivittatum]XP_029437501.1 ER membrane protein complex subunit 9 [Rhinatrema bivittatum]